MPYLDKTEQREYQRKWIAGRRRAWLDRNGPCKRCGSSENLEIDHIDRRMKISHRIWSWSDSRRLEELRKCQVLCQGCHLTKSYEIGDLRRSPHGSQRKYVVWKCRCSECRRGNTLRRRKQRAARG